jgi:hypothetical protein
MKKDYFIIELIKSTPFKMLIILALLILLGVVIANRKKDSVKMKEDIMYIAPEPSD